jgi:hypothetical protein
MKLKTKAVNSKKKRSASSSESSTILNRSRSVSPSNLSRSRSDISQVTYSPNRHLTVGKLKKSFNSTVRIPKPAEKQGFKEKK